MSEIDMMANWSKKQDKVIQYFGEASATVSSQTSNVTTSNVTTPPESSNFNVTEKEQQFKLNCQPGEQRQFSYESSTKVWGSTDQQVRLRAIIRLRCMEPPTNTTLKYLAEVVSLLPNFIYRNEPLHSTNRNKLQLKPGRNLSSVARMSAANARHFGKYVVSAGHSQRSTGGRSKLGTSSSDQEAEIGQMIIAEPLLEEVSEVAVRMKRSVSGWFTKAWSSVKDFFGNIFTSSERSTVSRDQAFKESGLDIAGQCKSPSTSKGRNPVGLPFDESVFEDLGPEYYVGASLDGATAYEFSDTGHAGGFDSGPQQKDHEEQQDDEVAHLSFFDDPSPRRADGARAKRATAKGNKKSKSIPDSNDYNRLLRIPFVFLQSRAGKIIEIRFSSEETDLSVKNFKRHLCDLFATNLDWNKTTQNEVSPIGKHQTMYTLDSSENSIDSIKQTVLKANSNEERANKQQLVRVLATIGTNDRRFLKESASSDGNQTVADDDDRRLDSGHDDLERNLLDDEEHLSGTKSISILRSINTTSSIQLSSKMLSPDIERIQVRVKQVQQINDGRLIGTAGQLSMSLMQMEQQKQQQVPLSRARRDTADESSDQVSDISDLLKVSTSFSMHLVPIPHNPDGSVDDGNSLQTKAQSFRSRRSTSVDQSLLLSSQSKKDIKTSAQRKWGRKSSLVKLPPENSRELQRVLQEWRKQEARLQLSSTNLMSENNGQQESQLMRIDILRDQIKQRLNEEFVRNRIRRSLNQQQVAASSSSQARTDHGESKVSVRPGTEESSNTGGDLGLGLTQLVLGTGITTKRKGSIYSAIEEVIELENSMAESQSEFAVSRLVRETIKLDKLKQHCKSSIPRLDELDDVQQKRSFNNLNIEKRLPFGIKADQHEGSPPAGDNYSELGALRAPLNKRLRTREVEKFEKKNDRKLEQCQQVLQLMLRLSDRQATDLVIDLIDECNQRLLAAAKQEELGYGPMSKLYRRLRLRFIKLLNHLAQPNDSVLDKLLARLYYPKLVPADASKQNRPSTRQSTPEPEFVYVNQRPKDQSSRYNKSLLKEEDDFNNNDGAAILVMTLTSLAAKSSISRLKRVEVAEKLLYSLKGTSCSLFNAPDLDIIESMSSFQEPLDEIVGRILQLAHRCKQHDQYVVASIHGLSGQLQHPATQRYLVDMLKSKNSSCTIKSEIVLTLVGAQLINDLKHIPNPVEPEQVASGSTNQWPSYGQNKVDETLLELLESGDKTREPDKRCLGQLIIHYMSRKHQALVASVGHKIINARRASRSDIPRPQTRNRNRRAVVNEHNFWDDAQCKRWTMPADSGGIELNSMFSSLSSSNQTNLYNGPNTDLIDEIDDNSIITALANNQRSQSRGTRRNQKLIERELDSSGNSSSSAAPQQNSFLRKRHKCIASKDIGPKNAQATLKAEIVNDLIGTKDENKFLARFRLSTNFLGNRIDVGRMYLWHQRRTTRAYANILGRSIWDSSHGCKDKAPNQMLYMPLFDFNLWLIKVSVGLRLNAEMGFFSNCDQPVLETAANSSNIAQSDQTSRLELALNDELQLYPTISLKAAGEATAKLVVARAGMSVASQYSYQGDIRVSRQPESCMSIYSSHQPMNITFSSWFQLWDNDCHFWGSRSRAEPQAVKWRLTGRKPIAWIEDECLSGANTTLVKDPGSPMSNSSFVSSARSTAQSISP